jgi:hypothetical protein
VRIEIVGRDLPGRRFCSAGELLDHVHVAVQIGKEAVDPVPGDAAEARWVVEVGTVVGEDGGLDQRGPAVHGRRGDRFLYLTWGDVPAPGTFHMFRRAKLMFADIDAGVLVEGAAGTGLRAEVVLTDERGGPRCARVRPPAIRWSVPD